MKNLVPGLLLLGAAFGSGVHADTMDEVVGNEVVVNFADGVEIRYSFHADNTFTASWENGSLTGSWFLQGSDICIDVTEDNSAAECEDYPKDKRVGDSWTQVDDDDGSTISISIVPGSGASDQASDESADEPSDESSDEYSDESTDEYSEEPSDESAESEDQDDSGEDDDSE